MGSWCCRAVATRVPQATRFESGRRLAGTERVDAVVRQHETHTSVPAEFFDALIASLDQPAEVNPALAKAAARSRARAAQF